MENVSAKKGSLDNKFTPALIASYAVNALKMIFRLNYYNEFDHFLGMPMTSDSSAGNGKKLDDGRKKKFLCKHCLQYLSKRQFQRHKKVFRK